MAKITDILSYSIVICQHSVIQRSRPLFSYFYWPQAEPLVALTEPLGSTGTQLKTNERVQ